MLSQSAMSSQYSSSGQIPFRWSNPPFVGFLTFSSKIGCQSRLCVHPLFHSISNVAQFHWDLPRHISPLQIAFLTHQAVALCVSIVLLFKLLCNWGSGPPRAWQVYIFHFQTENFRCGDLHRKICTTQFNSNSCEKI
jgi:hypothetical protein